MVDIYSFIHLFIYLFYLFIYLFAALKFQLSTDQKVIVRLIIFTI